MLVQLLAIAALLFVSPKMDKIIGLKRCTCTDVFCGGIGKTCGKCGGMF